MQKAKSKMKDDSKYIVLGTAQELQLGALAPADFGSTTMWILGIPRFIFYTLNFTFFPLFLSTE